MIPCLSDNPANPVGKKMSYCSILMESVVGLIFGKLLSMPIPFFKEFFRSFNILEIHGHEGRAKICLAS